MPIRLFSRLRRPSAPEGRPSRPSKLRLRWKTILLWLVTLGAGTALLGGLFLTLALAWFSRDLPDPNTLMQREVPQSTKIFDRTGQVLLYEIHGDEKRTLIKIEDLPEYVKWSTISVEDKAFYTHHGLNFKRIIGAIIRDVITGTKAQGASTLTQQFVKNAILTNEKSWERKLKEAVLALQIERLYTKDQILQLYFNEIPYGSTLYGIESAAQSYFGKPAKDLTIDEAAFLAAIPQAPDFYSPYGTGSRGDNRDRLVQRQQMILGLMAEQGHITQAGADEAKKIETLKKLTPKKSSDKKAPHFVNYVSSQLIETYGQKVAEQGGLRVITSLDWSLQQIGEEEIKKGVDSLGPKYGFTNSALVAVDPKTGQVLAMVGSKDYNEPHFGQVNIAIRPRQPGSSFKPIVYAAGFAKGYTPDMTLWDVNTKFKDDAKGYEPRNYNLDEHGPISARMALQGSLNIPAVKMLYLVGVGNVLDFAQNLGYSTFEDRRRFGLALVLGGGEVKLLEHVNTYATFANEGKSFPITSILKVQDANGKTLDEWQPSEEKRAVDRGVALTLSNVLSDNDARSYVFRTRNALTLPDRPAAAKTGTTNNYRDAWTMGYIPQLAAGVWVGNNDNTEMKSHADGSVVAAPVWQAFMKRATKNMPVENFAKPPANDAIKPILSGKGTEVTVNIDKVSGKLATALTPPDLIEKRTYREAHSELWYLDKDDPRGPAPSNPASDPQFTSWEAAVQDYAKRNNWNATSTAPTEQDDVHTEANTPRVSILSPISSATINTRDITITIAVSAPRRIIRLDASIDNVPIGSSIGDTNTFIATIPASIDAGFHDLTVTAVDDVANKGSAATTINLAIEPAAANVTITSPTNGTRFIPTSFPMGIAVYASDVAIAKRIDVYQQEAQDGDTQLIGSVVTPTKNSFQIPWPSAPTPGTYYVYAVIVTQNDTQLQGPRVMVEIANMP